MIEEKEYVINGTKLILLVAPDRRDWLELRTRLSNEGRYGGSEIAAIMGLDDWTPPIKKFYETIGYTQKRDFTSIAAFMGIMAEDAILKSYRHYADDANLLVDNWRKGHITRDGVEVPGILINPEYDHMMLSIDWHCTYHEDFPDQEGITDAKMLGQAAGRNYAESGIKKHECQLRWYMMGSNASFGTVISWKDNQAIDEYIFLPNEKKDHEILDTVKDFHDRVLTGRQIMADESLDEPSRDMMLQAIEPELTGVKTEKYFIQEDLWKDQDYVEMEITNQVMEWVERRHNIDLVLKPLAKEKEMIENQIRRELQKLGCHRMIIDKSQKQKVSYRKRLVIDYDPHPQKIIQ